MRDFFDKPILSDDQYEETCCANGGISNEARYNDYRNRMPFHYIEDAINDGYYYWSFGATMEMSIELEDDFAFSNRSGNINQYISIVDFFKDSTTKFIKFVLQDFRGKVIDVQVVKALELEYLDTSVIAKYIVTDKLSSIMIPNQYRLFIYAIDKLSEVTGDFENKSEVYNKCLTENGILIKVK